MNKPVSAAIITFNEEDNIRDCLQSLSWCDEIVIVDAFSTDHTIKIAHCYTDRIIQQKWTNFAAQKQLAVDSTRNEWVLSLDADERVPPQLKDEILSLDDQDLFSGYYIARKSYFLGKWIRYCGWFPGYQIRLFQKSKTRLNQKRVHEGFVVEGAAGYLQIPLLHFTHPTLESSFQKMNLYSSLEARDRSQVKKVHWYDFILHPLSEFLRKYFVQKGFLEGIHGFILASIAAQVKMALYMKIWEIQNQKSKIE